MSKLKVVKWGNSLAIVIPARRVREFGVKEGDAVWFDTDAYLRNAKKSGS